jgi:hypothetical protein
MTMTSVTWPRNPCTTSAPRRGRRRKLNRDP